MFWGFSPAFDLCEEYLKHIRNDKNKNELNILLFGNCDSRHILKTIAKSYKHEMKINFYALDEFMESTARNLLLMLIAFERPEQISIKSKTNLFMDIYGNILIRPFSYNYLISKAKTLIKMVTDLNYMKEIAPIFNINNLKYRERDSIVEIFTFWSSVDREQEFDIKKYWENESRKYLGLRYDARSGVFDWDLQMRLKENGAQQLCPQEYKHWRESGIAFMFPEYEQSNPNKTLVNNVWRNGTKYQTTRHRNYDITLGPFSTYGFNIDDEKFMKSFHGENAYRATDITERNLYEIMYEIQEKHKLPEVNAENDENFHKYGSVVFKLSRSISSNQIIDDVELMNYDKPIIDGLETRFNVNFITLRNLVQGDNIKKEFEKLFDIIFITNFYFPIMPKDFCSIFNDESLILFETQLYSLNRKDDIDEFIKKIKTYAKSNNLSNITNFNINSKNFIVKYKMMRSE